MLGAAALAHGPPPWGVRPGVGDPAETRLARLRPPRRSAPGALRGDPSDNLPGIPGVGEKTAAKWINQVGSFAELVERAEEVK
ncbi:5'-3' exonuclease H3TH domain-containing protein, partial [Micromonospora chalcea]